MIKKILILLSFSVSSLWAYSYTCFPPMTQTGSIALNPVFFADDKNYGGMETFFYYGLTEKMDFCTSVLTVNGFSNFSVMSRYALNDFNAGIRLNPSWVIPQLNYNWEDDLFIIQATLASQVTYDYSDKPAIYGVLCPGYKFSEEFHICCDINPGYYLQEGDFANSFLRSKGFGLDIAPSIGINVSTQGTFSIAAPIYNVTKKATITFGAWLYYSIKGK